LGEGGDGVNEKVRESEEGRAEMIT